MSFDLELVGGANEAKPQVLITERGRSFAMTPKGGVALLVGLFHPDLRIEKRVFGSEGVEDILDCVYEGVERGFSVGIATSRFSSLINTDTGQEKSPWWIKLEKMIEEDGGLEKFLYGDPDAILHDRALGYLGCLKRYPDMDETIVNWHPTGYGDHLEDHFVVRVRLPGSEIVGADFMTETIVGEVLQGTLNFREMDGGTSADRLFHFRKKGGEAGIRVSCGENSARTGETEEQPELFIETVANTILVKWYEPPYNLESYYEMILKRGYRFLEIVGLRKGLYGIEWMRLYEIR